MRLVVFCHSLVSCWNHGNVHFLRGIAREATARGWSVRVFEPADGWSRRRLVEQQGEAALAQLARTTSDIAIATYDEPELDLDEALDGADIVLVHEWNPATLVARLGRHRIARGRYRLFFHDSHHRAVTAPLEMRAFDLEGYDGVLAFGEVIRETYERQGWARGAWTWHEAADTRTFAPHPHVQPSRDLVWIGNWGDDERDRELRQFLIEPASALGLDALVHGVRYPEYALDALSAAGIVFCGWLPNHEVPQAFAASRMTVHVPRRPYARALPGIPTIRMFEALACGIPLVSAPWRDSERLFEADRDYLRARDGNEMREHLRLLQNDVAFASLLAEHGLATIRARHTCAHRLDELITICRELDSARNAA